MSDVDFPFVSVIVAAYNSEDTIERCLQHLLALDYPRFEVIVVDNNSTDDTPRLIQQFPVTFLMEKKPGWPAARNTAFQHSQARFVANIDADCFAERDWLRNLMRALLSDERIGGVVGKTKVEPGRTLVQQFYAASDPFNLEGKLHFGWEFVPWGGGNNAYRKAVFETIGYYDSDRYKSGADPEFHQRMKRLSDYEMRYVPDALIWHVARGTLRELFRVSAKYSFNGRQRALQHAEFRDGYRNGAFLKKQGKCLALNTAGFVYRLVRFTLGRETKLRLVSPLLNNVEHVGAIYGYVKAGWQKLTIEGSTMNNTTVSNSEHYEGSELGALELANNYYNWMLHEFRASLRGTVLEVGAGAGTFSRLLLAQSQHLICLEPARNLIPTLRQRIENPRAQVVLGAFDDYAYNAPDASVDTIVCVNVLEHIQDDFTTLCQMRRILSAGGHLCLFVPALPVLYGTLDEAFGHYRRYTKRQLRALVLKAGFRLKKLKYFNCPGMLTWLFMGKVLRWRTWNEAPVVWYDRLVVPIVRSIESLCPPPWGQSLLLVASAESVTTVDQSTEGTAGQPWVVR